MEQLLLNARNLAKARKQSKGQLSISELLSKIQDCENVEIDAAIPTKDLTIHWEECHTPLFKTNGFAQLISSKLYSYKFQYLGSFGYEGDKISCRGSQDSDLAACETFAAQIADRRVYQSISKESDYFNCTWLIDMLLNASSIAENSLRNETLTWRASPDREGFELVLELKKGLYQVLERQIIYFSNNFEDISWRHLILLEES